MPNRRLTPPEIASLDELQDVTVAALQFMAGNDPELLFALRRRLFTRLMHLERGTPAHRTKLKAEKWKAQGGLCAICQEPMPQKGSELDRSIAWKGYSPENTRLVHHECHIADQRRKGFTDVEADILEQINELDEVSSEIDTCEIETADGWETIGIDEALRRRGEPMRCLVCHGAVRPHKEGTTGQRAHFEHIKADKECRLKQSSEKPAEDRPARFQRNVMRDLYRKHGGDRDAVCAAYAEAEKAGLAPRKRKGTTSAEAYAKLLWSNGINKGWLPT